MFSEIKGLAAVVALLLTAIPTYGEVVPEVTFSGGYSDNLFNDSSSTNDSYTAVSPLFKIYPSSEAEIVLSGSYTAYFDIEDLSNFAGSAAITVIPDLDTSPVNLMFSATVRGRSYGEMYEVYNYWGADADAILAYRITPQVIFRIGASGNATGYVNSVSGDNDGFGFFGGLNLTPYGSNSLNFEGGFGLQRYVTGLDTVQTGGGRRPSSSLEGVKSDYQIATYLVRYSRPFGDRIGFNAFVSGREFVSKTDSLIYGFSINFLSPWYSLWDGISFGSNIKVFPGGDFILESGLSYTDKDYVENLEYSATDSVYYSQRREDQRTALYVKLQRPFNTGTGMLVKPTVQVQWADNSSNVATFDVSYFDIQAWINFRF